MIPLRQVAEISPATGANQINRRDLNREVELSANVVGRSAGQVSAEIKKTLEQMQFSPGYRFQVGGATKNMAESFGYALKALLLAIIFIYMILASQFASFLQPVAIMSALPLTLIGVFLSLMFFRSTLNLFSIIGFVMLMGLVTKNAILLVDFANQAREGRCQRARGAAAGRADPHAPDHDDHRGDGVRHAAYGHRAEPGRRDPGADGPRHHRRRDHLDAADAGGGAGGLLLPGRSGGLAETEAGRLPDPGHHLKSPACSQPEPETSPWPTKWI